MSIHVRISKDVHKELFEYCDREDVSMRSIADKAIKHLLKIYKDRIIENVTQAGGGNVKQRQRIN